MRTITAIIALLALAACAQKNELAPGPGGSLPVAPYGAGLQPGAEALLRTPPQAIPDRTVELRRRSVEREDDPFDLPPPQ